MNDNHYSQVLLFGIGGAIIASAGVAIWIISSMQYSASSLLLAPLLWLSLFSAAGGFGYLCSRRSSAKIRHQRNQLELMVQKRTAELQDALEALQASCIEIERAHQEWEQAFDTIGDLVFLHDEEGRIKRANKAYITRAGVDYADILNKPYWEIFPKENQCIGGSFNSLDKHQEDEVRLKNGDIYRSKVYLVQNRYEAVNYSLHILTNITERVQLDNKLNLLLQAVEYSNASVVITDIAGKIQFVNRRFEQVTGYTRKEVFGKNPSILKSGETSSDTYKSMWETITAGREWKGEFHNRKKNGNLFWESATITPIMDDREEITGYMAIKEDINHQKLTQEALRRSQKMEALGQLTGGIAHDFNNLLGIIIGNLDFLKRLVRNDEKALNRIETAAKATLRGAALTRQLLSFSSRQGVTREAIDVNRIIREMEGMLARSLNPEVELQTNLDNSLWITDIDPGDLEDALLNLALNAKAAMPKGGKLTITTANIYLDEYYAHFHADIEPGEYIELTVSDTGCGMSREVQEHAFEPFYSTRPKDEGTGLGLSMVYGFVQRAGGHTTIQSALGKGTHVHLYLPRSKQTCESAAARSVIDVSTQTGSGNILVVDDERELKELTVEFLKEAGYVVNTAENGRDAMSVLAQHPETDLLFSDVLMPGGMNGYELAVQAQQKYPKLKVLFTSGFTDTTIANEVRQRFSAGILNKPFRKEDLVQRVRQALEQSENA